MRRIAKTLAIAMLLVPTVLVGIAFAQTPSPTPPPGPIFDVNSRHGFALLVLLICLLVVVWFVPHVLDIILANRARAKFLENEVKPLLDRVGGKPLAANELKPLKDLMKEILDENFGTTGLTRALIALTVLTAIGIALVLTLTSGASDAGDLRKTIITSFLSILATIAGFYFGSKVAQESAEKPPPPAGAPVEGPLVVGPVEVPPVIGPVEEPPVDGAPVEEPPVEAPVEGPPVEGLPVEEPVVEPPPGG